MAAGMKRYMDRRLSPYFKIQITSMVDMFVIILVFLLKSYSTSPVNISPSKDLTLPTSTSHQDPEDVLKMMISQKGVSVEDKIIISFENGTIAQDDLDPADSSFIPTLFKELDEKAKATRNIAKVNETVYFDGRILIQADRSLPYALLQKVMYTSMLAGYANLKLAVIASD